MVRTKIKQRTVRELGGEIWAEIGMEQRAVPESRIAEIDWKTVNDLTDFVMTVLARHAGEVIVMDGDLPVVPLQYKFNPELE